MAFFFANSESFFFAKLKECLFLRKLKMGFHQHRPTIIYEDCLTPREGVGVIVSIAD
jgi:hypothetical protein